jgi:hypothetical protein
MAQERGQQWELTLDILAVLIPAKESMHGEGMPLMPTSA